jgi:hypothetical protein
MPTDVFGRGHVTFSCHHAPGTTYHSCLFDADYRGFFQPVEAQQGKIEQLDLAVAIDVALGYKAGIIGQPIWLQNI